MLDIKAGDIFCVNSGYWVSRAITNVTGLYALDKNAKYSHSGIIINQNGQTFESLYHIEINHLEEYVGKQIIIGRHSSMSYPIFKSAFDPLFDEQNGRVYPAWRIALFLIPPLARYLSNGEWLVCSELAAKFLKNAGILNTFTGWAPDNIADMIRDWKNWSIIFEGTLTEKDLFS